jgi:hypothetical protein
MTQIAGLVSGGTGLGLLHLQQSLNKFRGSGAKGRLGRERGAGSVQLVGRTQVLQTWGSPFSGD